MDNIDIFYFFISVPISGGGRLNTLIVGIIIIRDANERVTSEHVRVYIPVEYLFGCLHVEHSSRNLPDDDTVVQASHFLGLIMIVSEFNLEKGFNGWLQNIEQGTSEERVPYSQPAQG